LKVLFDQNAPRPLAYFLVNHQVIRAAELNWFELRNGDLLRAAEEDGFDVFVTADRNLAYQQNLKTGSWQLWFCLPGNGRRSSRMWQRSSRQSIVPNRVALWT
jgi:hypothetical protein